MSSGRATATACRRVSASGASTAIHYPTPIHLQPAYRDLGYQKGDFPITERAADKVLSLPMYPELPLAAIEDVAGAVREFVSMQGSESVA
jgi:dTDP-4-amino-4,6-dideoxygalactose transaminase